MTIHDVAHDDDTLSDLAIGRYEPCAVYEAQAADGVCTMCGWLASDHEHDAEVVTLPPVITPAMRRAS